MSKRVKLDKSELIDLILEEVEKELTDEATSLGQEDPKYKKFPSTVFYADVADEYRAILPVVEKLLEANPKDRPYVADALEMMMFNVREGIHGPEMDESKLDEEAYDKLPGNKRRAGRSGSSGPTKRAQALVNYLKQHKPELDAADPDQDISWLINRGFKSVRNVRLIAKEAAEFLGLEGDEATDFAIKAMRTVVPVLKARGYIKELEEASAGDEDPVIQYYNKKLAASPNEFTTQRLQAKLTAYKRKAGLMQEEESE